MAKDLSQQLAIRKSIIAYLRAVVANPILLLERVKQPPKCNPNVFDGLKPVPTWLVRISEIMINAEISGNSRLMMCDTFENKGMMPNWANAVVNISTNTIINLRQINWMAATSNWSQDVTEAIISCLQGDALKTKVLDCILDEWRYKNNGASLQADVFSPKYDDFCTNLKRYIANSDLYSIEAIKQQENERLTRLESRMEALANEQKAIASKVDAMTMPKEFTTPKAKAILQRAVEKELCEPDSRGGYRWLKDDRLWAWFVFRTSDKTCLDIRKGKRINWQPYVALFGMSNRKKASAIEYISTFKNDFANAPNGYEAIDSLLEQV